MKKSWGLPIMLVTIIVMGSSSGCLGLLQMREAMEDLRDAPETSIETIKISREKVFDNLLEWEAYENTTFFEIDETVSEINIRKEVHITGSGPLGGCLENFTRYVRAELLSPTGKSVWAIDVCEDVEAKVEEISPSPTFETGEWKLVITARGGGLQNSALQDRFEIDLTIKRTCIKYPLEEICT